MIDQIKKANKTTLILATIIILSLISLGTLFFRFQNTQKEINILKDKLQSQDQQPNELKKILAEIKKFMVLPKNETPTLATVTDVEKLRETQPFYNNAKNGDIVLIYMKAKKAILYDPIAHKIIDVAPVNVPTPTPQLSVSPTLNLTKTPTKEISPTVNPTISVKTKSYNFALYNGSLSSGLAKKYEAELLNLLPKAKVVSYKDAVGDYEETVIINLNLDEDEFEQVASILGINSSKLSAKETKPKSADILIIIGEDKVEP